jgi:dTDP-4-amino-4,6-dideoxygalactose transaminase
VKTRPFDVPFNVPYLTGNESWYVADALASGLLTGDGPFTRRAAGLLAPLVGGGECLLTTSCTHALEMTALLLELEPGDEVIMPSFTFVSTANAFALRGAVPVFVDCRPDTLNIDERLIEEAITERTRAIVVVHYGGVGCEMDEILSIAGRFGLSVVEDNAHGLGATYKGKLLGSFGSMATQSFHGTKNIQCGEGGALVVNDPSLVDRAEILREKGTNRKQYFLGKVDKYRWVDIGSSYLPSDINAAILTAQLEGFEDIQKRRQRVWEGYAGGLADWARKNRVDTSPSLEDREHPAHLFHLLMPEPELQRALIEHLAQRGILATFHYVPLHSSPFGSRVGRTGPSGCATTESVSRRLVRLPLYAGLSERATARVIDEVMAFKVAA